MSGRAVAGRVLMGASAVLGVPSLAGVVYFGIEVGRSWGRPVGGSLGTALLGAIGEGIAEGLFGVALGGLAMAVVMFFAGRRLRQGES